MATEFKLVNFITEFVKCLSLSKTGKGILCDFCPVPDEEDPEYGKTISLYMPGIMISDSDLPDCCKGKADILHIYLGSDGICRVTPSGLRPRISMDEHVRVDIAGTLICPSSYHLGRLMGGFVSGFIRSSITSSDASLELHNCKFEDLLMSAAGFITKYCQTVNPVIVYNTQYINGKLERVQVANYPDCDCIPSRPMAPVFQNWVNENAYEIIPGTVSGST